MPGLRNSASCEVAPGNARLRRMRMKVNGINDLSFDEPVSYQRLPTRYRLLTGWSLVRIRPGGANTKFRL